MKYVYSEQYDAYYDEETNEWIEDKCDEPNCEFCMNRPETPGAGEKNFETSESGPENKKLEKRV
jgi:hypothetical protein